MAQIRAEEAAEQHAARLEDARLRVQQSRSATSNVLRSQQREHNRLQMAERHQQGKAYQPYNHLAFRYNPGEDYSLSLHVLISTMTVVCPYYKALKSCRSYKLQKLQKLKDATMPYNIQSFFGMVLMDIISALRWQIQSMEKKQTRNAAQ
ncbi:hypothetical protein NPIL_453621 [Nephila pilipes]|uniref:Uncharacterized protein n=1 Tax=Nephila pilipes TaxID=299642 RepID=A0A8X6UN55_NEPPI|nr:hypothetical protein NPIL_81111 [Nephila pilipes]GFU33215.1 hypothetical protein NPIL_453621 [Nephila pilipes]